MFILTTDFGIFVIFLFRTRNAQKKRKSFRSFSVFRVHVYINHREKIYPPQPAKAAGDFFNTPYTRLLRE